MDLNNKYYIYEVTHKSEDWDEDYIFHIVSNNGYGYPFYCPVCHLERGKLFKEWRGHTIKPLGTVTMEQILSLSMEKEDA